MLPTEEFESYTYILERSDRSGETNVTAAGCRVLSAFDTSQKSLHHPGRYGLVEYEGHDPVELQLYQSNTCAVRTNKLRHIIQIERFALSRGQKIIVFPAWRTWHTRWKKAKGAQLINYWKCKIVPMLKVLACCCTLKTCPRLCFQISLLDLDGIFPTLTGLTWSYTDKCQAYSSL